MIDFKSKFGRFAKRQIQKGYFIWLTTVDSSGTPQPKPVWFIWEKNSFLIYSQAQAFKVKHIRKNPQVALHFNTEDELGENRIIVLTGRAKIDTQSLPANKNSAFLKKYRTGIRGLSMTPEEFANEYSVPIRISPAKLRGSE